MSPFWPGGKTVRVHHAQNQPYELELHDEWRPVISINRHWRVHTMWWQGEELWRDYWVVVMPDVLGIIYQDLLKSEWYLERIYA